MELKNSLSLVAAEAGGALDDLLELRAALVEQHPAVAAADGEKRSSEPQIDLLGSRKRARQAGAGFAEPDTVEVTF